MVFIVSDQFSRCVDVAVAVIALVFAWGDFEEVGDGVDDDDDIVAGAIFLGRNPSESIIGPSWIEPAYRSGLIWPFCDDVPARSIFIDAPSSAVSVDIIYLSSIWEKLGARFSLIVFPRRPCDVLFQFYVFGEKPLIILAKSKMNPWKKKK